MIDSHTKRKTGQLILNNQCYTEGACPLRKPALCKLHSPKIGSASETPWDSTPSNGAVPVVWVGRSVTGSWPSTVFLLCTVSSLLRTVFETLSSKKTAALAFPSHGLLSCICVSIPPQPHCSCYWEFLVAQNCLGFLLHHPYSWSLKKRPYICRLPKQNSQLQHIQN